MKIIAKTLKGDIINIDISPDATVTKTITFRFNNSNKKFISKKEYKSILRK